MLDRDYLVTQAKEFAKIYNAYEGFVSYDVLGMKPSVHVTEETIRSLFPTEVFKTVTLNNDGLSQYEVDYKGVKFFALKNLYENQLDKMYKKCII